MPDSVRIIVTGVENAIKVFKNIEDSTLFKIRKQVLKTALKVESEAKKKAPSDTGRLRSSIQTKIISGGLEAEVFANAKYALHVEYGTKPHFPPSSALRGWARRHNMPNLEFIIARSISRRGTRPQPFLFPALEGEKRDFMASMRSIVKGMERG